MSLHYHSYQVVSQNVQGSVEVCTECKHRITVKVDANGRIDNKKYLKEHVRDTSQPNGKTGKIFKQYYSGNKPN
jgi:hypothetical protein